MKLQMTSSRPVFVVFALFLLGCQVTETEQNFSNDPKEWKIPEGFSFETSFSTSLAVNTAPYGGVTMDIFLDEARTKKIASIVTDIKGRYSNDNFRLPSYAEKVYVNSRLGDITVNIHDEELKIYFRDFPFLFQNASNGRTADDCPQFWIYCEGQMMGPDYDIVSFFSDYNHPITITLYKDETRNEQVPDGIGNTSYVLSNPEDFFVVIKNPVSNPIGYVYIEEENIGFNIEDNCITNSHEEISENDVAVICNGYTYDEANSRKRYHYEFLNFSGKWLDPLVEFYNYTTGQVELGFTYFYEVGNWWGVLYEYQDNIEVLGLYFNNGEIVKTIDYQACDFPLTDPLQNTITYYWPYEDGYASLVFEDMWPYEGDYDFNDLVVEYNLEYTVNGYEYVPNLKINYTIAHVGAAFKNGLVYKPDIGRNSIEEITGLVRTTDLIVDLPIGVEDGHGFGAHIVLFDNASDLVSPFSNETYSGSVNIKLKSTSTSLTNFSYSEFYLFGTAKIPGFDLTRREKEIHQPYHPGSGHFNSELAYLGDNHKSFGHWFVTENNMPWAFEIPEPFNLTEEKQNINNRYPRFKNWAFSGGAQDKDWYLDQIQMP